VLAPAMIRPPMSEWHHSSKLEAAATATLSPVCEGGLSLSRRRRATSRTLCLLSYWVKPCRRARDIWRRNAAHELCVVVLDKLCARVYSFYF